MIRFRWWKSSTASLSLTCASLSVIKTVLVRENTYESKWQLRYLMLHRHKKDRHPLRRKTWLSFEELAFLTLCTRRGSGRSEDSDVYRKPSLFCLIVVFHGFGLTATGLFHFIHFVDRYWWDRSRCGFTGHSRKSDGIGGPQNFMTLRPLSNNVFAVYRCSVSQRVNKSKDEDEGGNHLCGPVFGVNCSTESAASIQRQSGALKRTQTDSSPARLSAWVRCEQPWRGKC